MKLFFTTLIGVLMVLIILIIDTEEDEITELEYNLSVANTALMIDKSLKSKETNDR
jgi:hypothetical protein